LNGFFCTGPSPGAPDPIDRAEDPEAVSSSSEAGRACDPGSPEVTPAERPEDPGHPVAGILIGVAGGVALWLLTFFLLR
jgi:hypothetical protein